MKNHTLLKLSLCSLLLFPVLQAHSQWNYSPNLIDIYNSGLSNKVGIGLNSPFTKLHILENTSFETYQLINNRNSNVNGTQGLLLGLLGRYTSNAGVIMENNDAVLASQSGSLQFYTAQNNPLGIGQFPYSTYPPNPERGNLRMIIKDLTGYVGIGTFNPRGLLQIGDGNSKFLVGKMPGTQQLGYASMYFSFNGGRSSGNIWQFESDGSNNGGTVFFTTPAGGLKISTIKPAGNQAATQQITDQQVVDKTVFEITNEGRVLIGKPSVIYDPTNQLKVQIKGGLIAEKIKVALDPSANWIWPDFVFSAEYQLKSLPEIEQFIKENRHLPDVPSSSEVEKNGIDLAQMNAKLLQKVEELTLHLISQGKEIEELKKSIGTNK